MEKQVIFTIKGEDEKQVDKVANSIAMTMFKIVQETEAIKGKVNISFLIK